MSRSIIEWHRLSEKTPNGNQRARFYILDPKTNKFRIETGYFEGVYLRTLRDKKTMRIPLEDRGNIYWARLVELLPPELRQLL